MRKILCYFTLPLLLLLDDSSGNSAPQSPGISPEGQTGTVETLIVASGTVAIDLDLNRLNGSDSATKESKRETFRFEIGPNSFFTIRVFNNVLRGPEVGSMELSWGNSAVLPEPLNASSNQLAIEKIDSSQPYDLVVRDGKTGFLFFNIEGNLYKYDAAARLLKIKDGRLLISEALANKLGRPADAGLVGGEISIAATMYPIEVTKVVNGAVQSSTLPPRGGTPNVPNLVPGPDVIVGELPSVQQFGSSGTQVGLAVATTSCNNGDQELNWMGMPNTDHPVIPQNLYRMSGGTTNDERFEQIGQSWLKHAFLAEQGNECAFGCVSSGTGFRLGVGCSDPYTASLNANQGSLGSRAWVNPFTGAFPSTARDHTGHTHAGAAQGALHRLRVEANDLNTTLNPGATYFAEGQYVTPHEYAWCQSHPGQCNMYNNVSYRRFDVSGTTSFSFSPVGSTVRTTAAINAWTGATINPIDPAPGVDGKGYIGCKVTNPSAGVWHYEYAVYNQNLDRGIQSFSVPLGCGITASNIGFHAPLNHPGIANDGTLGDAGFSNAAWTSNQTASALSWSSETFPQNQNANAIRFGTLYNFRFDSNRPPQLANATVGFFKTGSPITVGIQGPSPCNPLQLISAVSRMTHGGAGDFDIDLPLTGEPGVECRNGSGNHTLVVTFSNTLVSGDASVTEGSGSVAGTPTFSGNAMTIQLTGVTDIQKITVLLSNVTDSSSQTLPNTNVSMNMLRGDATGSKSVNSSDVSVVKSHTGQPIADDNFREDITADGAIGSSDIALTKSVVGHGLP